MKTMTETEKRIDHSLTPEQADLYMNNSLFHASADALQHGASTLEVIGMLCRVSDALQHGATETAQKQYQRILSTGRPRHG